MSFAELVDAVQKLSRKEKLELIEAIAQMLQQADAIAEAAPVYQLESEQTKQEAPQPEELFPKPQPALTEVIRELMSRPDPEPEQMLRPGLLKGLVFDEEDFRAAEWHPSDEELENAGLSVHR